MRQTYFPITKYLSSLFNATKDFPLAIEVSTKFSVLYLLTKEGYFHLYDLGTVSSCLERTFC